jgi:triacylglycerol lipase
MSKNIILAHGILGFGENTLLPFNYFKGVAAHFEQQGHAVIQPDVNPIGSIQQRGTQLAAAIAGRWPTEEVHIIAHSMGGLDARFALAHFPDLAARVKTLVTIGTPHRGSPVADAIVNPIGNPLIGHIPAFIRQRLENLPGDVGGLRDLTTAVCIRFDETTPDSDGVRYIEVAGDAALDENGLFLFDLAAQIGEIENEINDGVVTRSSALRQVQGHIHLPDWPVDHAGEIGWDKHSLLSLPAHHLARYDAIVAML